MIFLRIPFKYQDVRCGDFKDLIFLRTVPEALENYFVTLGAFIVSVGNFHGKKKQFPSTCQKKNSLFFAADLSGL